MDRKVFVVILFLMGFLTLPSAQTDSSWKIIGGWTRDYDYDTHRSSPAIKLISVKNNIALVTRRLKNYKLRYDKNNISFILLDFADPNNPELLSEVKIDYFDRAEVIIKQNMIYLAYELGYRSFLQILEISDNKKIIKRDKEQMFLNGSLEDIIIKNELVAIKGISSEDKRVTQIIDISDKNNMQMGAEIPGIIQLIRNNRTYMNYYDSTKIFNISDINNPKEIGSYGKGTLLELRDNIAFTNKIIFDVDPETYETYKESYFYSYDLTDIRNPGKIDSLYIKNVDMSRVIIKNNFAYQRIISDTNYIFIINITDPLKFEIDTLECFNKQPGPCYFSFHDKYMIIKKSFGGHKFFDMSDPENPDLIYSRSRSESRNTDNYKLHNDCFYFIDHDQFKKIDFLNSDTCVNIDIPIYREGKMYNWKFINNDLYVFRIRFLEDTTLFKKGFEIYRRGGLSNVKKDNRKPVKFDVFNNYPNPFNPATTITFQLPAAMQVDIRVFNLMGQQVWSSKKKYQPGFHDIRWNAVNKSGQALSTGVYIIKVKAGDNVATQKAVLMK